MNSRSLLAAAFVAFCLLLGGLALHRQIAAHPMAPDTGQSNGVSGEEIPPDFLGQPVNKKTWHIARGAQRQAVVSSIQAQLNAFRAGDAETAMRYQSRSLRRRFPDPEAFVQMVRSRYPEFGHCRAARFGPVWTDADGQHADVTVTARGENGFLAQGEYEMIRGREAYRVAGVQGGERVQE